MSAFERLLLQSLLMKHYNLHYNVWASDTQAKQTEGEVRVDPSASAWPPSA